MPIRTFFDFVDHRGVNVIEFWLRNDVPVEARVAIEAQLDILRSVKTLERPAAGSMKSKECQSLIEIRVKQNRQQYRILAHYGPERAQVTLLIGAREKGGKLEPKEACSLALRRYRGIETGKGSIRERGE